MKMELRQQFQIESARYLTGLPPSHPCAQMHGHSFKITLTLVGDVDPVAGWVMDYHEITQAINPLLKQLDHKVLNNVAGLENPTSEMLCLWLYKKIKEKIPQLNKVTVSETATTECSYPVI